MAESFQCPRCGRVSFNPNDVREGYCGVCHDWTAVRPSAASEPSGGAPVPARLRSRPERAPLPAVPASRTVRGRVAEVHVTVVLEEVEPWTGEKVYSEYRSAGQPLDDYARVSLEPHYPSADSPEAGVPDYVSVKIETRLLPIPGVPLHVADQPHVRREDAAPETVVIRETNG